MVDDRSRVEKLVDMFGSSIDGERTAAGAMLEKAARERKLTIVEHLKTTIQIRAETKAETKAKPRWRDDGFTTSRFKAD